MGLTAALAMAGAGFSVQVHAQANAVPPVKGSALSAEPEIFRAADLALGTRMLAEHRCAECHARKVGGDGSAIYRPQGRIHTAGHLRGMVEQCNTELNLGLFPEEVTAVAAVLNRAHYRFER
ncbi:hypothetical protein [Inhella sp.]|uniref:hypothetical protein n=1 Tax=Inhella sp. TaxID=1921806 RepID=UPI0035ADA70B